MGNVPVLRSPVTAANFSFLIRINVHRLDRAHGNNFIFIVTFESSFVVQDTYIGVLSTNVLASDGS